MTSPETPHALPEAAVVAALGVSPDAGLPPGEVKNRLAQFGPNAIAAPRGKNIGRLLLHQVASPIVYLLATAGALAFTFGEIEEGIAIVVVLLINASIGLITELRAARSIEALRSLGRHTARVRRDHAVRVISADELVPGDIVLFDAGDLVSADVRLLAASRLAADESTLTGESIAVDKDPRPVPPDASIGDRTSMLFKGSTITRGSATGVVVGTGLSTELGHITRLVLEAGLGSSPIERNLARLSAQLVWATLAIAAVIAVVGLAERRDTLLMIESAIALAVAAIPEGLAIVATLALARGMWRMARQNALIERLSAVETLGATTVILTDKTGTLTENRMAVRRLATPSRDVELDGHPENAAEFAHLGETGDAGQLLRIAVLCNDADLARAGETGTGDPMEIALVRAGLLCGVERQALLRQHPLIREHAFDSDLRMMATVHRNNGAVLVAVKGAPEAIIAASTHIAGEAETLLDAPARAEWLARVHRLGQEGLRVIACATKTEMAADGNPYRDLVLVGLIGLEDPARADVPQALRDCHAAGIRVVMVTGDHGLTALSIGRAIGLVDDTAHVVEGKEIAAAIATGAATLRAVDIFARVSPAEKMALVKAYQAAGDVVAMTGDGVNDAPALRQADIGVAMGLRGTDVAREAAAMVLLDDAFPTIVKAIREGRIIFANIRRFGAYLLACNLSEVLVVGIAVLSGLPLPVMPLQILYLNLVTDVFPAFALAMGEGEAGILARPPRDPQEPILGPRQWIAVVLQGIALTAATFAALACAGLLQFDDSATVTVTFLTLAFAQLWHVFNMRSRRSPLFANEVTRNPWIWAALALCTLLLAAPPYLPAAASLLDLAPLTPAMWATVLGCSLAPLIVTQLVMIRIGRAAAAIPTVRPRPR